MKTFQLPSIPLRRKSEECSNIQHSEDKTAPTPKQEQKQPDTAMKTFHLPSIPRRRKSEGEGVAQNKSDSVCTSVDCQQSEEFFCGSPVQKGKNKLKIPGILKKIKDRQKADMPDPPAILVFNQNLAKDNLADASQQLLTQEQRLFSPQSSDEGMNFTENDEANLFKDYQSLILHLKMAIHDSFNSENKERLKSAVKAILQQEEQDKFWEEVANKQRPKWRPLKCKEFHNSLLKIMVEHRLLQANRQEDGADRLSTSLKREVCRMGMCIQKDLLHVVRDVQQCYTSEFDICNMYVQLYHQAFSSKLMKLVQTTIELQDCAYILSWIHSYYPKDILHHDELVQHINTETLGALLPEEYCKSLQYQYRNHKEMEVETWLCNALKKENESWQLTDKPEQIDGCYFSNLALDVIPIINGAIKESIDILGNRKTIYWIQFQLEIFLLRYKISIAGLIKGKNINIPDTLKANLVSIKQFREFIEIPECVPDYKKILLPIISEMRNLCHSYLLGPIHKELKKHYCKLWTRAWFSDNHKITGDLLSILENTAQDFSDLQSSCMTELSSQLHYEVMLEYVRRMLKGKLQLKSKDDQEAAARFLCEDSERINSVCIRIGSEMKWLTEILPKMSEVLKLQDVGALQLEIVMLARTYPDISECQVVSLLSLKSNLSKTDVRSIKMTLTENRDPPNAANPTAFFSEMLKNE